MYYIPNTYLKLEICTFSLNIFFSIEFKCERNEEKNVSDFH